MNENGQKSMKNECADGQKSSKNEAKLPSLLPRRQ